MIYLDNSATTFPKPRVVINSVNNSFMKYGANPGRGGHQLAIRSSQIMFDSRNTLMRFFNAPDENSIIFTGSCTTACNMVLKGLLKSGDHVVVSCLEHNAVMRPLQKLSENGINYTVARVYPNDNDKTLDSFRKAINQDTRLIFCIYASNVWGIKLPIDIITALAHLYGIPIAVDAAQAAGIVPIDLKESGIDFLCCAGHKGLYGPMGTGMLIFNTDIPLDTIIEGGTGSNSYSLEQPEILPDRFESGTQNLPGIVGLKASTEFIMRRGVNNIANSEMRLIQYLYDRFSKIKEVKLYTDRPESEHYVPLLSFNIEGMDSETISAMLDKYGIAVRAGLHCAPFAHEFFGTIDGGAVRVSPSMFTTRNDMDYLVNAILKIIHNLRKH